MKRWARAVAAAGLAVAALPGRAQTPPVFRAEVSYVYVDVFVSDGGRSVAGLRTSDFELRDDGVAQEVELLSSDARPMKAMLVFDTSSSLVGEKLQALRRSGEAFLDGLRPANEVSLVTFSEEIARATAPSVDKDPVRRALGGLSPAGATSVFDALFAGLVLADPAGRSLVVLFTDGEDNSSILGERPLQAAAERANALVHVVVYRDTGLVSPDQETEQARALRQIARASGGRFWDPDSPKDLRDAFAAIAAQMSERYVLRYAPQGITRPGWHKLDIRLRNAKGSVSARQGYWVAR
jgi:VWFA-related protein